MPVAEDSPPLDSWQPRRVDGALVIGGSKMGPAASWQKSGPTERRVALGVQMRLHLPFPRHVKTEYVRLRARDYQACWECVQACAHGAMRTIEE